MPNIKIACVSGLYRIVEDYLSATEEPLKFIYNDKEVYLDNIKVVLTPIDGNKILEIHLSDAATSITL